MIEFHTRMTFHITVRNSAIRRAKYSSQQMQERRFDLKMPACECQKSLGVDKITLSKSEQGKREPHAGADRHEAGSNERNRKLS